VDVDRNPIDDPEEWSQGVLITDLSNFIQPVIRYYVNDMVRVLPSDEPCSNMPILKVQGRTFPMFTAAGKKYSVAGLYSKAKVWPDLVNFQFVQINDDTIQVRGVCKSDPAQVLPPLCDFLKEFMASMGCPDARFTWSTDPLIPNKRGGKIPLYYNNQN
jgi:phenylacetate-coenzyme A ligase PaaK-like adenylate-forming protein